ncbi:MAG: phosphodiester glycosidase family protein [Roseovarius sp.]|nr:phosphodiester glycosidase family protein [Roseovarius sp.]
MRAGRSLLLAMALSGPVKAVECTVATYGGHEFSVCRADAEMEDIRLFLNDPDTGLPLATFSNVKALVEGEGMKLAFAMNAGMYHQDRRPVGYYVEHGREFSRLVSNEGPGNFGMLPNGVFCVGERRANVIETMTFLQETPKCEHATQSGPMLVVNGDLHYRFLVDSDSKYLRNGVGTSGDGKTVWFAISHSPVNFHTFARLFQSVLGTPNALYLDGNVSRLYSPELGRFDGGPPLGPIVGIVVQEE